MLSPEVLAVIEAASQMLQKLGGANDPECCDLLVQMGELIMDARMLPPLPPSLRYGARKLDID